MADIVVTSSEFDASGDLLKIPPIGVDFELPTIKTEVTIKNGIAAASPTFLDFDESQSIENNGRAWFDLHAAVKDASEILGNLDECNPPSLDDRFRLNAALDRIRKGADVLETHIARNGLWLSEDEWFDCDSRQTWHQF